MFFGFDVILAIFLALSSPAAAQSGRTFYIDFSSGLNSNPGTQSAPWKSHPYMQTNANCTGTGSAPSYSHQAGDRFIFRGGVTWPAACFTLNIISGGTSSAQDYYGVDLTWFSGGAFTRPLFDMANNKASLGPMVRIRAPYLTLDNIELARLKVTRGTDSCTESNIDTNSGAPSNSGVLLKNLKILDWTTDLVDFPYYTHSTGSICMAGGATATIDTVEMTDQNTAFIYNGSAMPFGACFRNEGEIKNSNCHHVAEGEVGHFGPIHDSQFHDLDGNAVTAAATAIGCPNGGCTHTNGIEDSGSGYDDARIYNSLFYNMQSGVTFYIAPNAVVYNNVFWNNFNDDIKVGAPGYSCCGTTGYFYNNSIDCSGGFACWGSDAKGGMSSFTVNLQNNLYITNGTAVAQRDALAGFNQSYNYTMSTTEAATYGFTSANKYAASSSDPNVVAKGANLATLCTGSLTQLCWDASGASWFGGATGYQTRPTGSTRWTLGAFAFGTSASQSTSSVSPPTALAVVVQ